MFSLQQLFPVEDFLTGDQLMWEFNEQVKYTSVLYDNYKVRLKVPPLRLTVSYITRSLGQVPQDVNQASNIT